MHCSDHEMLQAFQVGASEGGGYPLWKFIASHTWERHFCGAHISLQLILSRSAKRKDPMKVPCMGGCVELQEHSRLDGNRL